MTECIHRIYSTVYSSEKSQTRLLEETINSSSFGFNAPRNSDRFSPSLKSIKVGIACIPHSCAISSCASTSTLQNLTPSVLSESSSKNGLIILQGPHQSAQKSMTTGWPELMIVLNSSKLFIGVTGMIVEGKSVCRRRTSSSLYIFVFLSRIGEQITCCHVLFKMV